MKERKRDVKKEAGREKEEAFKNIDIICDNIRKKYEYLRGFINM